MAGSFAPSTFLMGSYKPKRNEEYDNSRIAAAENPRYNAGAPSVFTIPEMVATMFCCTEASCCLTIVVSTQCTAPCATVWVTFTTGASPWYEIAKSLRSASVEVEVSAFDSLYVIVDGDTDNSWTSENGPYTFEVEALPGAIP